MRLVSLLLAAMLPAAAATTAYWELNNYAEFAKGKLTGVSLTREGRLLLAPKLDTLSSLDQPVIWAIARGPAGTLYLATGHRGEVFQVDAAGKAQLLWTAPEPEVFTLAVDAKGSLYAATAPDGKIYKITPGNSVTAVEYFNPKAKYIWSLAVAPGGELYAGTGDQGRVYRITGLNTGELWYESGQTHITALAIDAKGRLLAGSEPNGILYHVQAKDKAFVLYDANLPEIRAIVPAPDGSLYVAALGGAYGKKQAGAAGAATAVGSGVMVTAPTTTITVEAAQTQGVAEVKPDQAKPAATATTAAVTPAVTATPVLELTGVDKSALYRIHPDNLVETLFVSKEENIYDLAPLDGRILFSTDSQGRVYRLEPDRQPTLLIETREGEATRLAPVPNGILVATSHAAKLLRLGSQPGPRGEYESPVHDATNAARWGRLNWLGAAPAGSQVAFRTRTGNSARPDKTWSDWSAPLTTPGAPITSPNARYIQWKVELTGSATAAPQVDAVTLAYLPQNTPPAVKSIQATATGGGVPRAATTAAAAGQASNTVYSVTVTDGTDAQATSAGTPTQTVTRSASGNLILTWQAEDTDGDKLLYTVWFRGEEESEWKLLKKDLPDQSFALEADSLADGKYLFKVEATDSSANPPAQARTGSAISAPILLDNTPPTISANVTRSGQALTVEVTATDTASALRRAEVSVNAGPWTPLAADDGVADSKSEKFSGRLDGVPAGELAVTIRAVDAGGNAGTLKRVLR